MITGNSFRSRFFKSKNYHGLKFTSVTDAPPTLLSDEADFERGLMLFINQKSVFPNLPARDLLCDRSRVGHTEAGLPRAL